MLAGPDLWKTMLLNCSIIMTFSWSLSSWCKFSIFSWEEISGSIPVSFSHLHRAVRSYWRYLEVRDTIWGNDWSQSLQTVSSAIKVNARRCVKNPTVSPCYPHCHCPIEVTEVTLEASDHCLGTRTRASSTATLSQSFFRQ